MSQPAIRQVAGAPRKHFWNTGASTGQLKSEPILAPTGSCRFEATISRREPTCTTRQCASAGSGGGGVRIRAGADRACRARRIKAGGKARGQPRSREHDGVPVASVQKTTIRTFTVEGEEKNEGLRPHIRRTKTPDFVHVYCGILPMNRVFFLASAVSLAYAPQAGRVFQGR